MKLAGRIVTIMLSENGREVLELAGVTVADPARLTHYVEDSDAMGIWLRLRAAEEERILLVRWEYLLSVHFPAGETKTVGFAA